MDLAVRSAMRVTVAANRKVPLNRIADHLVRELAALPMGATVVMRAAKSGRTQPFEAMTAKLCKSLSIPVEWEQPEGRGREAVMGRDNRMIRASDRLLAYVYDVGPHVGGTWHLIEAAIRDDIESTAYWVTDEPEEMLAWIGGA